MRILEQGFCPAFSFGDEVAAAALEWPETEPGMSK
jgi:hypothetical protein